MAGVTRNSIASGNLYTGPAVPTTYDPLWPTYTNLTPAQKLIFQSMPQALVVYSAQQCAAAIAVGISATFVPVAGQQAITVTLNTDVLSLVNAAGMRQGLDDNLITGASFMLNGVPLTLDAAGIKTVHQTLVGYILTIHETETSIYAAVNAQTPTITTRKQIDAAIAAVAPNSPSALNPSAT